MDNRVSLKWVEHLKTEKEKQDFFDVLKNNRYVLLRLKEVMEEDLKKLNSESLSDYKDPSWAFRQADVNGQKRQIRKVLDLLSFI